MNLDFSEQQRQRLEAAGKPFGLSPEEVFAANAMGMPLERYRAFRHKRSVPEMEAGLAELEAQAKAKADADHARRVEALKGAA